MDNTTQNFIHALSQLQFHYSHGIDTVTYTDSNPAVKEQIELLDGLSLLLVFAPTGDVAATGFWRTKDRITLLWSKNDPVIEQKTLDYVESLCSAILKQQSVKDVLEIVIPACRPKILERCKKLARSFGITKDNLATDEHNLWNYKNDNPYHQELKSSLIKTGLISPTASVSNALDNFVRKTALLSKNSPTADFRMTLAFAWALSTDVQLKNIVTGEQTRRVNKLGDYTRTLKKLPDLMMKLSKDGPVCIDAVQITPPQPQQVSVYSSTLDALNLRCEIGEKEKITNFEDLRKFFEQASPGHPATGFKSVKVTQHCELTILLDILRRHTELQLSGVIEIGVSKASCQWCEEFIDLVRASTEQGIYIIHRATQGKQPDGWLLPACSEPLAEQMRQSIARKVDHVFWAMQHIRRRSDSAELPGLLTSGRKRDENYFKDW